MTLGLVIDTALVVLVATMVGYCVLLDRRLGRLREGQAELARVATAFQEAIGRAEVSLVGFQAAGKASGDRLNRLVAEARALGDELAFLAERGERSAARLAGDDGPGRAADRSGQGTVASQVERELAAALRAAR